MHPARVECRGGQVVTLPPTVPLKDVVSKCLEEWDVQSDSSEDSDEFCGWRVGSRADHAEGGGGSGKGRRRLIGVGSDRGASRGSPGKPGVGTLDIGVINAPRRNSGDKRRPSGLGSRRPSLGSARLGEGGLRNCAIS